MKRILKDILVSLFLLPLCGQAQEWVKKDSIILNTLPTSISTDFLGYFYLGFDRGSVVKYDSELKAIDNYSLSNQSPITSLEAQNNLRLFLFQEDNQTVTVLDRFGALPNGYSFLNLGLEYVTYACPAVDQDIWTLEINPTRLKKIDFLMDQLKFEIQLSIGGSISTMRTFQNLLVISSEKGTYVLDQFGNILNQFEITKAHHMQLYSTQAHMLSNNQEIIYDLEKSEVLFTHHLPADISMGAYLSPDKLIVVDEKRAYLLERIH